MILFTGQMEATSRFYGEEASVQPFTFNEGISAIRNSWPNRRNRKAAVSTVRLVLPDLVLILVIQAEYAVGRQICADPDNLAAMRLNGGDYLAVSGLDS